MIKPFKFLSFSVIAAAVLYGGVKGYLYFNIKSELDDAIAMAGPFVHIEYGGIGTGLDGRISIEEVNIFPPGIDDPLRIESLSVQWPHIGYLLSGVRNTPGQALPERMILAVKGAHLPTKGGLADSLRQNLRQAEMTAGRKLPDPCSLQGSFGGEDYAAIGYHELVVDAKLGYELEQSSQELTAQFEFHLHDMQTLSMDITLTGISQPAAMMMGVIPRLKEYTATFHAAPDYVAKVVGYCADRRDQTEGEYIQALVNETGGGFEPGAGLREAIKRYLENPREILVRMRPAEPLDVSTLAHYKPEDIVTLLGLQVQVGGEELRDLSFDLALPERHTAAAPGRGPGAGSAASGGTDSVARSARSPVPAAAGSGSPTVDGSDRSKPEILVLRRRYLATEAKDLEKYVGRDVRLFTNDSKQPRSGVLISVQDGQAHVEQRVHSGTMTTFVPMVEIKKAEVFRVAGP